jgi:hypothetical protein
VNSRSASSGTNGSTAGSGCWNWRIRGLRTLGARVAGALLVVVAAAVVLLDAGVVAAAGAAVILDVGVVVVVLDVGVVAVVLDVGVVAVVLDVGAGAGAIAATTGAIALVAVGGTLITVAVLALVEDAVVVGSFGLGVCQLLLLLCGACFAAGTMGSIGVVALAGGALGEGVALALAFGLRTPMCFGLTGTV